MVSGVRGRAAGCQQKNWTAAIADIEAASRLGAPKPGRNVFFYGDVYRDFNPDYYLGVAFLNLKRLLSNR